MSITTIVNTTGQLLAALAGAHAGDAIELAPGTYSSVVIYKRVVSQLGATPSVPTNVTITSEYSDRPAVLTGLAITESAGITFQDLTFSTASTPVGPYGGGATTPFRTFKSSEITFTGINVEGSPIQTYATDVTGLYVEDSSHVTVQNSTFSYLHEGLDQVGNTGVVVSNNAFSQIADDAIRGGGTSNIAIIDNTFTSQHENPADLEHPDAIQFWTTNTSSGVSDILISGNTITRGDGNAVQGIFLHDEVGNHPYTDVVIQDNVITGELYNGIYVDDAISASISHNTVVSYPDFTSSIDVIHSIDTVVSGNSAGYYGYLDDIGLTSESNITTKAISFPSVVAAGPIPEPTAWSLMLLGATVCGGVLRSRRPGAYRSKKTRWI